jgi:hypothetical protein
MGFRGTLGRTSLVGCECEPRGEATGDDGGGDEVAMWREEASSACVADTEGYGEASSPASREVQQP